YGCPLSAIADGIVWAVDNGADVLNLSLGGSSGSAAEQTALQYARSNGVLPFCAAGNASGPVSYPAAFPECVAVSATDWGDELASYSNFGPQVELSAPGGDGENADGFSYILSSYNESSTSYAFVAGTSQASPQA
ncbi:MAG: S8 family serine peptidase, partial [Gemmatimonadetes bacterium]|nr:S8 family serine peptidase [Gemmatimonadota bacterium]NIQ52735.1 S8 family serine peptidase [Gemmatimonadota bacterium]NIU77247.1 S8 family serine peptidase [Gammaproteobacteria bacterium]NIX46529.1 S8 family serine peptidase [Gemmatimonadota bacterium]NIY10850.1 S8 family serine peptidase [Gemmatimonadota bacterium]